MSDGNFVNPWGEGGSMASDWSPTNAESLGTPYADVQTVKPGFIAYLPPPPIATQDSDYHCWAAALESLLYATLPPEQSMSDFSRLANVRRVKYHPRNLDDDGNPSQRLLRADETLRTTYPGLHEIRTVYQEIFDVQGPQAVALSQLIGALKSRLDDQNYVILSFGVGGSYWHDWIVYGLKKVNMEYRIMIMDPDENQTPQLREEKLPSKYLYIGWRKRGAPFAPVR